MKTAQRSDFEGFRECHIRRSSTSGRLLLVGGFVATIVLPLIFGIWTLATDRPLKPAVLFTFAMLPVGFAGFVLSFRASAFCRLCSDRVEQFWSFEERPQGRYSGLIAVCRSCQAFEANLSRDDD